ncbi:immunoglobulin kappa light chain-like isoform X2 [Protopterus annectens]|uniref:immunoglobulin kappa light chain-like isoform X2 n=1 Tax=Protopterus annectens TaxID=7888 RepID=UPI001CF96AC8|nr:immunoglobulin kappa light chain-like isoform X2 [Protopterus annectens]
MLIRAWSLFFIFPVLQTNLVQSPPLMRILNGHSASLNCKILKDNTYCFDIVWYIQRNDEAPQRIEENKTFSPSKEKSQIDCSLTIYNVQKAYAGTYFCACCHYTLSSFGNGTKLFVTDGTPYSVFVFILPPSDEEMKLRNTSTLICIADSFPDDQIEIYWNVGGNFTYGLTSPGIHNDDGIYSVKSLLTIPTVAWDSSRNYTCIVDTGNEKIKKILWKGPTITSDGLATVPSDGSVAQLGLMFGFCLSVIALLLVAVIVIILCYLRQLRRESPNEGYQPVRDKTNQTEELYMNESRTTGEQRQYK